jgi:hypothetical protein
MRRNMPSTFLGKRLKPGVRYAKTPSGMTLPILDVTDPVSVPRFTQRQLDRIVARTLRQFNSSSSLPIGVRRWMAKHSILLRTMMASGDIYLGGVATYLCKLGPEAFGGGIDGWLNRKVAGVLGPVTIRMRIHAYVRLLADELIPLLERESGSPLHLVNIAGGVASDSWNTLLVLRKERPELLDGRAVRISVLDLETEGPEFGRNVITELTQDGAPLHGLDVAYEHIPYEWKDTGPLRDLLCHCEEGEARRGNLAVDMKPGTDPPAGGPGHPPGMLPQGDVNPDRHVRATKIGPERDLLQTGSPGMLARGDVDPDRHVRATQTGPDRDLPETGSPGMLPRENVFATPIVAVSSEGGLFEYGTDEEIRQHLKLLRDHLCHCEDVPNSRDGRGNLAVNSHPERGEPQHDSASSRARSARNKGSMFSSFPVSGAAGRGNLVVDMKPGPERSGPGHPSLFSCVITGSAVKDSPVIRAMQASGRLTFFVRSEQDIARLAADSGWRIGRTMPNNLHYHIFSLIRDYDSAILNAVKDLCF